MVNLFFVTEKNLSQRPCLYCSRECKNNNTVFKKGHDAFGKKGKIIVPKKEIICFCGKKFYRYESSIKSYKNSFCSHKCKGDYRDKQNPNLRYDNLHDWVRRKRGKPLKCEHCGTCNGRLEWANKSHEYKKDENDWISLCKKCHYQYDKNVVSASVIFNIHTENDNMKRVVKLNNIK